MWHGSCASTGGEARAAEHSHGCGFASLSQSRVCPPCPRTPSQAHPPPCPHFIRTRPFIARGTTPSFSFCRECSTGSTRARLAHRPAHSVKASQIQPRHPACLAPRPAHLTFFPRTRLLFFPPLPCLLPPLGCSVPPRPSVHVSLLAAGRWRAHVCLPSLSCVPARPPCPVPAVPERTNCASASRLV